MECPRGWFKLGGDFGAKIFSLFCGAFPPTPVRCLRRAGRARGQRQYVKIDQLLREEVPAHFRHRELDSEYAVYLAH